MGAIGLLLPWAVVGVVAAPPSPSASPPASRRADVVERLHGEAIADPYRWLEDGASKEVEAWTAAQTAHLRKTLDALPGRPELERELWAVHEAGSLGLPVPRPLGPRGPKRAWRYFYTRRDGKQNHAVLYVRDGLASADRVLFDVNALDAKGTHALDWWFPSEDGRLLAYGVSADGSEESVLHVRDVATGADRPDTIERTRACSVAWLPDGHGFYYTRYPRKGSVPADEEPYHRQVFFHRLGDAPADDTPISGPLLGRARDKKDWPSVALSPRGRYLAIVISQGWSKSELYLVDRAAGDQAEAWPIAVGQDALFDLAELTDDALYVRTNQGAPKYRLFKVPFPKSGPPARSTWREILPEGAHPLEQVALVGSTLAALYLEDAASRVRLYNLVGKSVGEVGLPALGSVGGLSGHLEGDELFVPFTSFLSPTTVLRQAVRATRTRPPPTVWRRIASPVAADAFVVTRDQARSKDGTVVPLFVVHRRGLERDPNTPTVLYGYGGFNVNLMPGWSPSLVPFLQRGGVYVLSILRGGGEYGETWHQGGMGARKQNVFDDFLAAAEHLVTTRVTSPAHLGIMGRSNGGLLVGAALTQRPDLFRAVVCGVPLLDMLRYHKFRVAQLWIPEYGSADDVDAFRWLRAYSPYHQVRDGAAYPAVLLATAASDTRVDPLHARKMTARLQAATSSGRPILLRLETQAGHGAGKPLAKVIDQLVDEWSFLFAELGVR